MSVMQGSATWGGGPKSARWQKKEVRCKKRRIGKGGDPQDFQGQLIACESPVKSTNPSAADAIVEDRRRGG